MNKYRKEARLAAKVRRKQRMCEFKASWPTLEAAFQKGNDVYNCPYCKQWHRSGQLASLVARLARP